MQIQYSRISHHALSGAGITFSIPLGEDFTIINGSASWNGSGTDLADREIGINTADNKAYLRIGANLNQIAFFGSTASSQNLAQTLSVGNNTELYNIIAGTGTFIYSANGGGQLELDNNTIADRVLLSNDNGGAGGEYILMANDTLSLVSNAGEVQLTNGTNGLWIMNTSTMSKSVGSLPSVGMFINTQDSTLNAGVTNSIIIGGKNCTATEIDTVYTSKLNIFGDATGYNWKHNIVTSSQSTATTSNITTISLSNDQVCTVKTIVNAYCSSPNRHYSATQMASFLKYGGTVYQTGTTDLSAKDGFVDGTTVSLDTDTSVIRLRVTNGSTLVTRWVVAYEYMISGT